VGMVAARYGCQAKLLRSRSERGGRGAEASFPKLAANLSPASFAKAALDR